MGVIRSLPENQVSTTSQIKQDLYYVSASVCGWQYYMEDFQIAITQGKTKLFAVIDGHNGPQVAELTQKKLQQLFKNNDLINNMDQPLMGLQNIISELEELIYNSHSQINQIRNKYNLPGLQKQQITRSGCGLVLVAISQQQIIIGNIGLCKCYVTYRKDKTKAILFSGNHICSNKEEQARVLKSSGFVYNGRVNGVYPYTRSIGDFYMKRYSNLAKSKKEKQQNQGIITSMPSFFSLRKEDIKSIFLGSSGIWQKPQTVSSYISELGKNRQKDEQQIQQLINTLIAVQPSKQTSGLQNMTAIYISLNN